MVIKARFSKTEMNHKIYIVLQIQGRLFKIAIQQNYTDTNNWLEWYIYLAPDAWNISAHCLGSKNSAVKCGAKSA